MIRDHIKKYFLEENLNCAESVFLAANEALNLGLSRESAKLVSAFGGGMGCGSTCGALAGAMAVLGHVLVRGGSAHTTEGFKERCAALKTDFEARLGSTLCSELKPRYFTEEARCYSLLLIAADALDAQLAT